MRIHRNGWVLGYISSFNGYALSVDDDVSSGVDANGLISWVDNYCATHPLDTVSTAAFSLVMELRSRNNAR
jgi:hypothetical protein